MSENKKAARVLTTQTAPQTTTKRNHIDGPVAVQLRVTPSEALIDSRLVAELMGVKHRNVMDLLNAHPDDFKQISLLTFQMEAVKLSGARGVKHVRFAWLTEDQSYLMLAYSRNTPKVRALKINLVRAFGEARRAAQQRTVEYLPTYHALHDAIAVKAAGSRNQRWVHANANRLVNKACGLEAGQRPTAPMAKQSMLTVAQAVAASAMQSAPDHHAGYQRAKAALQALSSAVAIEGPGA